MTTIEGASSAAGLRVAVVVSKYHDFVTDRLQAASLAALTAAGVAASDIQVVRVPGAFEIPLAAQHAAETGRFHAVVCLGRLIRGEHRISSTSYPQCRLGSQARRRQPGCRWRLAC